MQDAPPDHLAGLEQVVGSGHGEEALAGLRKLGRQRLARPLDHEHVVADGSGKAHAIGLGGGKRDDMVRGGDQLAARRRVAGEDAPQGKGEDVGAGRLDIQASGGGGTRDHPADAQVLRVVEDTTRHHRGVGSVHARARPLQGSPRCYAKADSSV